MFHHIARDKATRSSFDAEDGTDTQPLAVSSSKTSALGGLLVGCAGWSYPHWRNKFYPSNVRAEHELQFYQQRFNACEINFTFHQMPTVERCDKWRRSSPPGFFLSLKAPKALTHISPLSPENHMQWAHFISAAKALGDRLGPILIQLPPSFAMDLPRLRALQPLFPKEGAVKVAFEFRHNSWFCDDVYDIMRLCNWALVKHAVPSAGVSEQWHVTTSDWVYVRLHGKKEEHVWDYTSDELQPYAEKITELRAQGQTCFVYFLNDADARAPANATAFFRMVRKAAGEKWEGLLGVDVDGSGVLKGMFGKQRALPPQHNPLPNVHETCSPSPDDAPSSPSATLSICIASPTQSDADALKVPKPAPGIMRFFPRQTPPSLSAASDFPPPAKKARDGIDVPASTLERDGFNRKEAGANRIPPTASAIERNETEVIVLD
jgi:uncharacterized protein YecE (DUF72 family)